MQVIEGKIKEIGDDLEKKIDEHVKAIEKTHKDEGEEFKKELKGQIGDLTVKYNDLMKEKEGIIAKMQSQLDHIEIESKKKQVEDNSIKTFGEAVEAKLKEETGEKFEKLEEIFGPKHSRKNATFSMDIETKAVILESTNLSGPLGVIPPGRKPGILVKPEEANHIRQIIPVGSTSSDKWSYTEETNYTDGTAPIAEGTAFPQSDLSLEQKSISMQKIAAHMKMSNELLEDIPGFMTFAQGRMMTKYMLVEDNQMLLGDGTGQNLSGLLTNAVAFDSGGFKNSYAGNDSRDNDVLAVAINQARVTTANGLFNPNVIVLNPTDVTARQLERDADGRYILPDIWRDGVTPVKGVSIFQTTIMTAGTYLVGDFNQGAEIIDRRLMTLQVSTEDQDDFIKDLATMRISSRLNLPIYFTGAFVTGTFAAGKDALNASPVTP